MSQSWKEGKDEITEIHKPLKRVSVWTPSGAKRLQLFYGAWGSFQPAAHYKCIEHYFKCQYPNPCLRHATVFNWGWSQGALTFKVLVSVLKCLELWTSVLECPRHARWLWRPMEAAHYSYLSLKQLSLLYFFLPPKGHVFTTKGTVNARKEHQPKSSLSWLFPCQCFEVFPSKSHVCVLHTLPNSHKVESNILKIDNKLPRTLECQNGQLFCPSMELVSQPTTGKGRGTLFSHGCLFERWF